MPESPSEFRHYFYGKRPWWRFGVKTKRQLETALREIIWWAEKEVKKTGYCLNIYWDPKARQLYTARVPRNPVTEKDHPCVVSIYLREKEVEDANVPAAS